MSFEWKTVDWTRSDEYLMGLLRVSAQTIARARAEHGKPVPRKPTCAERVAAIDTSLDAAQLARKLGVSVKYARELLRLARKAR